MQEIAELFTADYEGNLEQTFINWIDLLLTYITGAWHKVSRVPLLFDTCKYDRLVFEHTNLCNL